MKSSVTASQPHVRRAALFAGSALQGVLAVAVLASPVTVAAQAIDRDETGDISESQETVTAGPRAVTLTSDTGNVVADFGTITVENNGVDGGWGLSASTGGAGTLDLTVDQIVTSGSGMTRGIVVSKGSGDADINVGSITSSDEAIALSTSSSGSAAINVAGDITSGRTAIAISSDSATQAPVALWTTISVAENASVTGDVAVAVDNTINNGMPLFPGQLGGILEVLNDGTITGTSGVALALDGANATVLNSGTIVGDVIAQGGQIENRGGTIDGSVTLNSSAGQPVSIFAYEGTETGVTGAITGGLGIDTFAQSFRGDATAIIGGGLPTAFDRYGVISDPGAADVTITIETAANPVGATPSLFLLGEASIINRANLSAGFVPPSANAPLQIMPAVYGYGFAVAARGPFNPGFTFDGSGVGPASFTNEADITGQISLSTSEFINNGSIVRSSAGQLSVVTARLGEAFSFTNNGTIAMVDQGNRVRVQPDFFGSPFTDPNPYFLPETALTIASAVSGTLDEAGIYVPATINNTGTIDGGLLTRMTASEFTFDNSGTISGFNGQTRNEIGLTILLGRNYDSAVGDQTWYDPAPTLPSEIATIVNSGEIRDSFEAHLIADVAEFTNSGLIAGNAQVPDALFLEHSLENDTDAASFSFINTGEFDGNVGLELEATITSILNSGTITGAEYELDSMTFDEVIFGGETAFEIDSETYLDSTLTFTNTGSVVTTARAGSAVTIEGDTGDAYPDGDGTPLVSDLEIAVVNSGTISATGGATLVTSAAVPWFEPGEIRVNPLTALGVDGSEVTGASLITIDNQEGALIRAGGALQVATPNAYVDATNAPDGLYTAAIHAAGKTINITNAGTIEGGQGSTLAPNMTFEGFERYEIFLAGAIQTLGSDYDENGEGAYVASTDLLHNTATGVIVGSINLGGNDDIIRNAGRIEGAVHLGTGDDVLELAETSVIEGLVDLGDGEDRVVLAFSQGVTTGTGQVAATVNAETLAVQSGNWRADGAQSVYEDVSIAQGATLTVAQDSDGEIAIATPRVAVAGRLNLELADDTEAGDLAGLVIDGTGSLHLTGEATVLVDDAAGLQHTGGTFVENGELLLTDVFDGTITTSGDGVFRLAENGHFTGDLVNNGTFAFSRSADYDFLGDFSGSGLLEKGGDGTLTFAGLYAFTGTTTVLGGAVKFTGQLADDTELDLDDGVVDFSDIESGTQTIGQLSGQGGTLQLGETQLVINQFGDTAFSGSITGMGDLIKDGEGDLKLNGDGTGFTGTGQVDGGTLSVNGDFSNANFIVNQGGTLGGAGTIGGTTVDGGTLAPGNSIDTLTVAGNAVFTAGSIFEVEVNAAGESDLLQVSGTATLGGAAVSVIAESGVYRPQTDYTILTAAGGLVGTFGPLDINLAFLDPSLSYSANAVTLRLVRNNIDFSAAAETANQAAIGNLIEDLGLGSALYDEALTLTTSDVAASFASLTGEVYPAYSGAVIETAEILRRQTSGSMAAEGAYSWATGLYNNVASGSGAGGIELVGRGVAGGFGFGGNGLSVSAGMGILDQNRGGGDFTDGEVTFAIGQVAYQAASGLSVSAGAQFGWLDGETRRQTRLGTIGGAVNGAIDGDYLQLFGELGYRFAAGSMAIEPFVGVSHVALDLDGVSETGAATALTVAASEREVTFGTAGVRLSGEAVSGVRPFASAAYRKAWGDRASLATAGFGGAGGTALIGAVPVARNAAELSAGVAVTRGPVDFEVSYDGAISEGFDSHGLNAGIKLRF